MDLWGGEHGTLLKWLLGRRDGVSQVPRLVLLSFKWKPWDQLSDDKTEFSFLRFRFFRALVAQVGPTHPILCNT